MPGQAQAEMGQDEAEAIVARGFSELPEIVSAHCTEDPGGWNLVVVHDYGGKGDVIGRIASQIVKFEDRVPHLFIAPLIVGASSEANGSFTAGMKTIYRRK